MSAAQERPATRAPALPRDAGGAAWRVAAWPVLALLALLFGALTALRRLAYRRGWWRAERAKCAVLSVGNLSAGGSGKTPLVDWLLHAAQEAGARPVAISRGYRNRSAAAVIRVRAADGPPPQPLALGDEPAMLARRNPHVPVYVARRRVLAARLAAAWDRPGLIVLDDGFQHLRLARDLDVVLVDARQGLGNGRLLPLGPLREPLRAARRAHAVLITKANLGDAEPLRQGLHAALNGVPVFTADYLPARLRRLDGEAEQPPQALQGASVHLLCGIAQPQGFVGSARALGAQVAALDAYPDHHPYDAAHLARLGQALSADAEAAHAPRWITTEKDAVKLAGRLAADAAQRLWVLEMTVQPDADARAFFFDFIRSRGLN